MIESVPVFLGSALRLSTPLILAATGEVVSERAGVLNLSLEGMMLTAAFSAALAAKESGSATVGLLCGVLAATVLAALQAVLSVRLKGQSIGVGHRLQICSRWAPPLFCIASCLAGSHVK